MKGQLNLGSHSLCCSSPVPDKPYYAFSGHEASEEVEEGEKKKNAVSTNHPNPPVPLTVMSDTAHADFCIPSDGSIRRNNIINA